jgi:hypothetical protein
MNPNTGVPTTINTKFHEKERVSFFGIRIHLSLTGRARGGFSMKPPLDLRFCLMRNQIAIASRRDRTFAIQLWDGLNFMGRLA